MEHPVLWHFTFSHFAEKVRWALDFKRIPHVRRALLPGPHYPLVFWMTGQPTLPVLSIDGETIADSTRIIAALEGRWPDPPLYPTEPADRQRAVDLEEFFDEELGHYLRRFLMYHGFEAPDSAARGAAFFTSGRGPGARLFFRSLFPGIRAFLRWRFDINSETGEVARTKIAAAVDRIEAELQPSGYLVGDRFSVADLTAAALLAPLVAPPGYPVAAPILGPAGEFRDALAARVAFRWVGEMYRRHRGTSAEVRGPAAVQRARPLHSLPR